MIVKFHKFCTNLNSGDSRYSYLLLATTNGQPEVSVFDEPVTSIWLEMRHNGVEDNKYYLILHDLWKKFKDKSN